MNESKGQEPKKKRGGRAKNAFGDGGKMVSNEIYRWSREKSGNTVKDSNNNNNAGGVRSPKYFI